MLESLRILPFTFGSFGATLSTTDAYFKPLFGFTLVAAYASPNANDSGLTVDCNNVTASSTVFAGIDAAVKATPGAWLTPAYGGTNTAVHVAAGDILNFDFNSAAANTQVYVQLYVLLDEVHV